MGRLPECNGRGSAGDHCCYINGEVCEFLSADNEGTPRCSLFQKWGSLYDDPVWRNAPAGRYFAEHYPGFECGDWPQNIPGVMAREPDAGPFYACCWGRGNNGNVD